MHYLKDIPLNTTYKNPINQKKNLENSFLNQIIKIVNFSNKQTKQHSQHGEGERSNVSISLYQIFNCFP